MNAFVEDKDGWMKDPDNLLAFHIIKFIDDNTDILHILSCNHSIYFHCGWHPKTCSFWYWWLEQERSYIVCSELVQHKDCLPHPNVVWGKMHEVFTIAPLKKFHQGWMSIPATPNKCLMTAVVQVDPQINSNSASFNIIKSKLWRYGIATLL